MRHSNGEVAGITLFLAVAWLVPGAISRYAWIVDPDPQLAFGVSVLDGIIGAGAALIVCHAIATLIYNAWCRWKIGHHATLTRRRAV